jgi:hypothetical protein
MVGCYKVKICSFGLCSSSKNIKLRHFRSWILFLSSGEKGEEDRKLICLDMHLLVLNHKSTDAPHVTVYTLSLSTTLFFVTKIVKNLVPFFMSLQTFQRGSRYQHQPNQEVLMPAFLQSVARIVN